MPSVTHRPSGEASYGAVPKCPAGGWRPKERGDGGQSVLHRDSRRGAGSLPRAGRPPARRR